MEEEVGLAVAQALNPKLSAFRAIDGKHLRAARHFEDCGRLSRVILDFGHTSLIIDAIADDDSIAVATDFWHEFIDVLFGWDGSQLTRIL
jgi:hypothetical protein